MFAQTSLNRRVFQAATIAVVFMACSQIAVAAKNPDSFGLRICEYSIQLQDPANRKSYLLELEKEFIRTGSLGSSDQISAGSDFFASLNISDDTPAVQGNPQNLDKFSVRCLTCHDDLHASGGEVVIRSSRGVAGLRSNANSSNHPIGMSYDSYTMPGKGFKKIAGFNTAMKFFDGKVGCLTCHDPISPVKKHLVMSDAKSALCLTCHDK